MKKALLRQIQTGQRDLLESIEVILLAEKDKSAQIR